MSTFLMTVLYIVIFILFLSILVIVHELGHFSMAKLFKVYCQEFSIGFGPKLISRKKKNGETTFSLRAVPFGGYVSMYGEGADLPEGVVIDESRSLNGIKKWKRAIILVAGVVMNCILAFILFFTSEFAFKQHTFYSNQVRVQEDSIAYNAGLRDEDILYVHNTYDEEIKDSELLGPDADSIVVFDDEAIVTYDDDSTKKAVYLVDCATVSDFDHLDLNYSSCFFLIDDETGKPDFEHELTSLGSIKHFTINLIAMTLNENPTNEEDKLIIKGEFALQLPVSLKDDKYTVESLGLSYFDFYYRNSYGESVKLTFKDFGRSSTVIVKSFGMIFTDKEARQSVGGVIAIGFETTSILKNFGFGKFLYIWGLISVNLAIVNLLPFPGLDGWQLLVLLVEAIAHKEIPNKVKNIISIIGLALVFILMALLIFKDVFKYII